MLRLTYCNSLFFCDEKKNPGCKDSQIHQTYVFCSFIKSNFTDMLIKADMHYSDCCEITRLSWPLVVPFTC